jgi:hypothetical protein
MLTGRTFKAGIKTFAANAAISRAVRDKIVGSIERGFRVETSPHRGVHA